MASEQIRVDVVAKDDASEVLDDVAATAEALEGDDVRIALNAQADKARAELREIKEAVGLLDAQTATVKVDADTGPARAAMRKVSDDKPGVQVGESFVRDMTGAMGEGAAQVGGVFADVTAGVETTFQTLGTKVGGAAGDVVARLGGAFTTALGIGGVAFVAVTELYKWWNQKNEEQKRKIEETYDLLKSKGGDAGAALREQLGKAFEDLNDAQRDALIGAGVNLEDIARAVEGKAIPAMGDLQAAHERYEEQVRLADQARLQGRMKEANAHLEAAKALEDEDLAYQTLRSTIDDKTSALGAAVDKYRDLQRLAAVPIVPIVDTKPAQAEIDRLNSKLAGVLASSYARVGNLTPSGVAAAQALDYRRQGPR